MKRLVSLFICLALAIGCMSGCGGKTNSSSDISASGMKILFSLSQADDFRSAVANKAKETAEKAGATVDIVDEEKLNNIIRDLNLNEKDENSIRTFVVVISLIAQASAIKKLVQKIVNEYHS